MVYPAQPDALFRTGGEAVFAIDSTPLMVRSALRDIAAHPFIAELPESARSSVELVLAEVLNNIVEHAYDRDDGKIDLRLRMAPEGIICDVFDNGIAMPDGELPDGLAPVIGAHQDLAEGGFGWFLIRTLTENLVYRRIDACNHLSFQLNIEQ